MKHQWLIPVAVIVGVCVWALCGGQSRSTNTAENSRQSGTLADDDPAQASDDLVTQADDDPVPELLSEADLALDIVIAIQDSMNSVMEAPRGWAPPPEAVPAKTPSLPSLDPSGSPDDNLREAIRWFEALPKGKQLSPLALDAAKTRMAKIGLELSTKECREGICRTSFTYAEWTYPRPPKASAQILPHSWSFTTIAPDGRVEAHVFMVSNNQQ
jgi:hypothetical protein